MAYTQSFCTLARREQELMQLRRPDLADIVRTLAVATTRPDSAVIISRIAATAARAIAVEPRIAVTRRAS